MRGTKSSWVAGWGGIWETAKSPKGQIWTEKREFIVLFWFKILKWRLQVGSELCNSGRVQGKDLGWR